ncbi:hypothetical protein [Kineosporia sp. A_224]|uniref:hypothetical protein n=1 Tax=Kineosporia sp. A_224 TaxID=1962180 RepID=UPI00117A7FC9|nr:hypothetical protein [Kineosporia sp. A_224]
MTEPTRPGEPVDPVEDLLRATLEHRAQEPVWRASLVTDAVRAARTPAVRRVPPVVAWLSAAAAVVVLGVGATAVARDGGTVTTPGGPGPATPVPTGASSGPSAPGSSGPGSGAPDVEYASCAQARAELNGATAEPHNRAMTMDPLYTGPGSGDWVSGGRGGTATGSAVVTGTVGPAGSPTEDPAFATALADLDLALDGRRFAYMNVGADLIVVNVVRGVDEKGARALVRSCTPPGADVRTQLVDRSQTELEALYAEVSARAPQEFPDLSGAWIDTDTNRVLLGATTTPTRAQVRWVQEQWGPAVAVADLTTQRVVVP